MTNCHVSHALVIVAARIGDTLLVTPSIRALKESHANCAVTVLAHPKRMELLRHLPFIDHLASISKRSAPWRGRLGRRSFDIALVYGSDLPLIRYALRVSHRVVVFEQAGLPISPRLQVVPRPATPMHAVHERLLLARAADAGTEDYRLNYCVSNEEMRDARQWLKAFAPLPSGPLIGLQTLSFPTKAHRNWPLASFIKLMEKVLQQFPAAHFVILGNATSRPQCDELQRVFPGKISVAAGKTSIRESAALIACLDLYVGVDTGPTHLAGALGVPMLALYHSAYPGRYLAPLGHPKCIVIEHPLTGHSIAIDHSMSEISPEVVWEGVRQLLAPFPACRNPAGLSASLG